MKFYILLAIFLPQCLGRSLNDVHIRSESDADIVFKLVTDTLITAQEGISVPNLMEAAKHIQSLCDTNSKVLENDVASLLQEIAQKNGITPKQLSDFKDIVTYRSHVINDMLETWNYVTLEGKDKEASGQAVDVYLAAIAKIASELQIILRDTADAIKYLMKVSHADIALKDKDMKVIYETPHALDNRSDKNKRGFCIFFCIY